MTCGGECVRLYLALYATSKNKEKSNFLFKYKQIPKVDLELTYSRSGCLHLYDFSANKSIYTGEFSVSFETFGNILRALFSF